MALTPTLNVSKAYVASVTGGATSELQLSKAFVAAVTNYPTEEVQSSKVYVTAVTGGTTENVQVSKAYVTVVAKGRVDNPNIRAWTYTLDGHDYYVLRLGTDATLVFDLTTEQVAVFGSGDTDLWRAFTGQNWQGGNFLSQNYGSNVLVGDDGNGALYFLNPDRLYDDDALQGSETPRDFPRTVTGQVVTRSFDAVPCYGVLLGGAIGEATDAALTAVTLYTSDDQGHTWDEHDTLTVDNADYDARLEWWSLGSIFAPGRLFKVQDRGALKRIDFLEMVDGPDEA
jgi:hypothetical protein